ncbi:MAG: hypothetical protein IPM91_15955 [Bacteroidetes bacterium]|nr:hypothetical protein [Bacteroidota bacterium]
MLIYIQALPGSISFLYWRNVWRFDTEISPFQGLYDEGISRRFNCFEFFELKSLLRQNDIDVFAYQVEF